MANAQVGQSAVQVVVNSNPHAVVGQSVVQLVMFGGPPPPVPPVAGVTQSAVGGPPWPFTRCTKPNLFDHCLDGYLQQIRRITFPPLCSIPPEYRNTLGLPWGDGTEAYGFGGAVPEQAVPFLQTGGITTPAPAAGDQIVTHLRVPHGYDGLLAGVYWLYSGQLFQQGSGDIIWRLRLNQRYVKDLSNVTFQLGAPQTPVPLTEGLIMYSDQTLQLITNVPNLSGLIQVGASTISGGLIGFYWPR